MVRFVGVLAGCMALSALAQAQTADFCVFRGIPQPSEATVFDARSTSAARLELVQSLSESIAAAWEHLGRLEQGQALARLARAKSRAEANADLPGIASWIAELEAMTAVTAAQLPGGPWVRLTDQSLERMASLDRGRVLRPAEAPPQLVVRADAARQRVRAALTSTFEVSTNAPGAVLFVDDVLLGALPREVEVGAGRHLLRIAAPEHSAFGQVLDFEAGQRSAMHVRLARDEVAIRREQIQGAASLGEARALLGAGERVLWVEAQGDRSIVVTCTAAACSAPEREEGRTDFEGSVSATMDEAEFESAWMDAKSWLVWVEPPPPEQRRWYQHWGVWAGIGTALVVGIAASARALRPEPERRFQTTIRFNDL